MEDMKRYEMM